MTRRFCRYIEKMFGFRGLLGMIEDSRVEPQISAGSTWLSGLFMFATGRGSLNAIVGDLRVPKMMERIVGKTKPSGDSCLEHHKDFIAVLKKNNPSVLEDAEGLRKMVPPQSWIEDDGLHVTYWDIEGFQRDKVDIPLRVLSTQETETKRRRIAQQWQEEQEIHHWSWITSIPPSLLSTPHLWLAAHRRWDIENPLFNVLVTYFALDHCFKHHPTAIINFVLTLFIAFVLVQCF